MPTPGTETRLYEAIKNALATIGTPTSNWLTTPTMPIADGTPNDAVTAVTNPQLFLQFFQTIPATGSGMTKHRFKVYYIVWMVAANTAQLLSVKSDVLRALFAAEGTITALQGVGQPMWPDAFQYHTEMRVAGNMVGSLIIWTEVEMDHSSP